MTGTYPVHTYTVHYSINHELVDYGLCSDGSHQVLLKIGNVGDNRHKDSEMSLSELKELHELIGNFLKGVEE